jgi:hypothetical protein
LRILKYPVVILLASDINGGQRLHGFDDGHCTGKVRDVERAISFKI